MFFVIKTQSNNSTVSAIIKIIMTIAREGFGKKDSKIKEELLIILEHTDMYKRALNLSNPFANCLKGVEKKIISFPIPRNNSRL